MSVPVWNLFKLPISRVTKLKRNMDIVFDDGETLLDVDYKSIIVFRCIMDIVTVIPGIKIPSTLYISNYLNFGYFNYNTYTDMYSKVLKQYTNDVVKPINGDTLLIEELLRCMYISMNNLLSHIDVLEDYVIGVEILDVFKIQFRDKLLASMAKVSYEPSQANIEKTYTELNNILVNLKDGDIIKLIYLSKMVNDNQLRQLFGSRGYITEIDSTIYKTPMSNSFTFGVKNIPDIGMESRSSAKASNMSIRAIQRNEYTARGLQLANMPVERIWFGDCGNRDYTEYYVKPRTDTYKGDLPNLYGKYYYSDVTNKEELIDDVGCGHLEGTTIKLRMVDNCKYEDKTRICSKCIGDLAYSYLSNQNIGHISPTNPTRDTTQSLLSTKHLTKSATTATVLLNKTLEQFFMIKFKDKLFVQRKYRGRKTKGLKLHIPQNQVRSLEEVIKNKDVMNINVDKVSKVYEFVMEEFTTSDKHEDMYYPITVKTSGKTGVFTNYFWSYVMKHGYDIDEMDNYTVDLDKWDYTKPIIMYEKKEYDFSILAQQLSKLIKTRKYYKSGSVRRAEYTPNILVEKLFDLLNNKLNTNIAILEIMVYAFTAKDISNNNYDLSRNSNTRELIGIREAINERSVGGSFGWEKLSGKIFDPGTLIFTNKPDNPMDVLFKPNEVLADIGPD